MVRSVSTFLYFFIFCTSALLLGNIPDDSSKDINEKSKTSIEETNSLPHTLERRAALDIGSGQIKIQVSDVDLTVNKITTVLFTDAVKVPLREDLHRSLDGRLSADMQDKLVDTVAQLMKKASLFHPDACHAVATETLRLAKNGHELVNRIKEKTGLPVTIISQEEEGVLGFISAISATEIDPDKVVSWDFGGGSLQITARCGDRYSIYQGRLGKIPLKNALLGIQGKDVNQVFSPNPISKSEANRAIQHIKENMKDIPQEIRQKLNCKDTVVLGVGINPLWGMRESASYDKARVLQELDCRLHLDDEAIVIKDSISPEWKTSSAYVVSNLILAYGVMDALEIQRVHNVATPGANAVGTLLSPQYWEKNACSITAGK